MLVSPSAAASSAACAAIQAKMPVVIGQPMVAPCFLATTARISLIVISFPSGTRLMMASTSRGAGMATVPLPQRRVILPVIGTTFGSSLSSASFSRHDLRLAIHPLLVQRFEAARCYDHRNRAAAAAL